MRKYLGLCLLGLLSACATPPPDEPPASAEEPSPAEAPAEAASVEEALAPAPTLPHPAERVTRKTDAELCELYGGRRGEVEAARAELEARGRFTAVEWRYIDDRSVVRGMDQCAVTAALSANTEKVVNVTYSNGDHGRTLFYSCRRTAAPHCPYTRINMRGGRVSSVSQAEYVE